jgi:hypothetical protein
MYATQEDMDLLLESVNKMATCIEELSARMDDFSIRMDQLSARMEEGFIRVDQRLNYLETRLERIEKNMVHKAQFNSLLIILEKKQVITSFEKAHILFPPIEDPLS